MIEKGQDWGRPAHLPVHAASMKGDRALAAYISEHEGSHGLPVAALTGGDLARTLGLGSRGVGGVTAYLVPVDAIEVAIDEGTAQIAAAHVVIGSLTMSATSIAIMNAAFIGSFNVAPRAHPGDGWLDVVTMSLSVPDRLKARRRMPLGTHVPHPSITTRRRQEGRFEFERPRSVRIDGHTVGRARSVRFRVRPGAAEIAV